MCVEKKEDFVSSITPSGFSLHSFTPLLFILRVFEFYFVIPSWFNPEDIRETLGFIRWKEETYHLLHLVLVLEGTGVLNLKGTKILSLPNYHLS